MGEIENEVDRRQQHEQSEEDGKDERRNELSIVQRGVNMSSMEEGVNHYPLSPQGWSNLNNTIQVMDIISIG